MSASSWRRKPVVVQAVQWTGGNEAELADFTTVSHLGSCFDVLDEADRLGCNDPAATAQVYDKLHSTWVLVFTGDWIIKGVQGEFYPIRDAVFRELYEPADGEGDGA